MIESRLNNYYSQLNYTKVPYNCKTILIYLQYTVRTQSLIIALIDTWHSTITSMTLPFAQLHTPLVIPQQTVITLSLYHSNALESSKVLIVRGANLLLESLLSAYHLIGTYFLTTESDKRLHALNNQTLRYLFIGGDMFWL